MDINSNKNNIKYNFIFVNKIFKKYLKHLPMFHYWMCDLEKAYIEVFKEMCKLLDADILFDEYYILLQDQPKPKVFKQLHYYINSLWKIINKTKHNDALYNLTLKLSNLLIEEFVFVFNDYLQI